MHLLGRDTLNRLYKQNESLDKWLIAWTSEIIHARWWCPADVLSQFPKAEELSNSLFVFKTEPKEYCIAVQIAFTQGVALITDLTELEE